MENTLQDLSSQEVKLYIIVNRESKEWEIDRLKCIQCGYCAESCPKKCIEMKNEYTKPTEGEKVDSYFNKS